MEYNADLNTNKRCIYLFLILTFHVFHLGIRSLVCLEEDDKKKYSKEIVHGNVIHTIKFYISQDVLCIGKRIYDNILEPFVLQQCGVCALALLICHRFYDTSNFQQQE